MDMPPAKFSHGRLNEPQALIHMPTKLGINYWFKRFGILNEHVIFKFYLSIYDSWITPKLSSPLSALC